VAYEASRSAAKLPPLLTLPSESWLDEPIEITKENFQAEVVESETPVLLDFWAAWCRALPG